LLQSGVMKPSCLSFPTISSLALVLLGALSGCSSVDPGTGHPAPYSCTAIGCVNGADFDLHVEASADWLRGDVVEVCRNDRCARAEITQFPDVAGTGIGAALAGAFVGQVTVWKEEAGYRLDVHAEPEIGRPLANGDRYTFRLIDKTGARAADVERTATYVESYPNGKDCDVVPCLGVRFDLGKIRGGT
jgi:hypothetical protein